ncbi:MAG: EAL domain-containing protein, partial [Nitrospirota bacterium]|nr:EAL domain-containing protein [Nitrospirota bacterium]
AWILAMLLSLAAGYQVMHNEQHSIGMVMKAQADHAAADISAKIDERVLALVRMANRLSRTTSDIKSWESDARLYLTHYSGYEFLGWLDSSLRIVGYVRHEPDPVRADIDLAPGTQQSLMRKALDTGQPVVSPIQYTDDKVAVIKAYVPIHAEGESSGLLVASFQLHQMLDRELVEEHFEKDGYFTILSDGNAEVVFPEEMQGKFGLNLSPKGAKISVFGAEWTVTAWPVHVVPGDAQSNLGIWVVVGGLLVSSLMSWSLYQARRSRGLVEWFQATNTELADQIAERMKATDGLKRMNRLHAMLSKVNDAIVHIETIPELYDEISRIAVHEGGFLLAWVGIVDRSTGMVKAVSHAGDGAYLENIRISIDETLPEGQGPTGKSLRNGQSFVCADIENADEMLPWRDAALRRGFRSSAAIPFRVNSHLRGALSLYAGAVSCFEKDELEVIHRMVENLVFAISSIEREEMRKSAEQELKKFMAGIEHSVNVIIVTDTRGVIEYVNPVFERVTGWKREEALGRTPALLASGETPPDVYKNLWETILSGQTWRGMLRNRRRNGEIYWGEIVISPITDENGRIVQFLAVQEDVTEKRAVKEKVDYLAHHDELTGLANRATFMDLLKKSTDTLSRRGGNGVLLLIDIDDFGVINDAYGHTAGDEMLRGLSRNLKDIFAQKMSDCENCALARLGGDEFGIFIPGSTLDEGLEIARQIRQNSTVSISAVAYPEHASSPDDMMAKADAALRSAKKIGRNVCHAYRPEDRLMENIHLRVSEKNRIEDALAHGRFTPWYQPILHLPDNKVSHYEVLARMIDEEGRVIYPNGFISTAEQMGLIANIDLFIMREAMKLQAKEKLEGRDISFGINISGKNLGNEELLDKVRNNISETGANPDRLVFEITETEAIRNMDNAIIFLNSLKDMGCRLALDDFGVGFTAFSYIKNMHVDYLKIDGSFIKNLHKNTDDQHIVRSIVAMAKGLGVRTVAEFVEDGEVLELLREYGVDYAQGYFIGRPSPELC